MTDQMVLKTQQWLNATYKNKTGFGSVEETGKTGWDTINALIRALQIELGITATANNFGSGTQSRFKNRWPNGIRQNTAQSNVHGIIQGALWCKGYPAVYGGITNEFTNGMVSSIKVLKQDIGMTSTEATIDLELMMALLSMKQFKLLSAYGGKSEIRAIQQEINRRYKAYSGIVPTDGLYGREMNKALIQVLQAIEGFTPSQATGNFGTGTKARLKTISGGTSEWVWIGTAALVCNGIGQRVVTAWDPSIPAAIKSFQNRYKIPQTGKFDPTTWMSLLTSKGDPNRPCVACDTRFEITAERLNLLKANGYEIVGRYLTEPNQDSKDPSDYFKAIRPGELERITNGGMKFFPIFQEYSTKLRHFTRENGARHATLARQAAQRLGIPGTYIYFAVDFDATDPEVTSHILPYFQGVRGSLGGGYKVGIYASRNICSRIIKAGYAGSAFVSDMSTGFSGNLGFPIPDDWNYDQFTEISDYKGAGFDLDRVAYSGQAAAVDHVAPSSAGDAAPDTSIDYNKLAPIDLIWHLEKRFEELRASGKVGKDYVAGSHGGGTWVTVPTWRCILNYLAKAYLRDGGSGSAVNWSVSAESFRSADANVLEKDAVGKKIIAALNRYIDKTWRQSMTDKTGESVDLAHLAATTLGYTNWNLIPDAWTGWAGDLATAMENIQKTLEWNPSANLDQVATALVGQGNDYRQHPGLKGLVLDKKNDKGQWDSVGNNCNRDDLCCDGDAIIIANTLENGNDSNAHLLSATLREYYNNSSKLANRFKQIGWSLGANNSTEAYQKISEYADLDSAVLGWFLAGYVKEEIRLTACRKLAEFIY
ncbi:glycoside hydrolase domain-containing protein [Arcanobacterium hippocoleae]|uniref:Peptidoglycan hydrolase-like protein with peptidoglycan-binding domain n=1 Tax=Arcanobacterium hippocoleae TaxID=149017 RepID=A0ABU1T3M1_9ACTO|nr:glycoside hydrolase domain-containing protein [Arcanobacterium hippocoleae]MDR6939435.1 peptidoglycan hydrolase-like protein with peptidoglycan-binding domain [Arcanobacterium hippocoleae]